MLLELNTWHKCRSTVMRLFNDTGINQKPHRNMCILRQDIKYIQYHDRKHSHWRIIVTQLLSTAWQTLAKIIHFKMYLTYTKWAKNILLNVCTHSEAQTSKGFDVRQSKLKQVTQLFSNILDFIQQTVSASSPSSWKMKVRQNKPCWTVEELSDRF